MSELQFDIGDKIEGVLRGEPVRALNASGTEGFFATTAFVLLRQPTHSFGGIHWHADMQVGLPDPPPQAIVKFRARCKAISKHGTLLACELPRRILLLDDITLESAMLHEPSSSTRSSYLSAALEMLGLARVPVGIVPSHDSALTEAMRFCRAQLVRQGVDGPFPVRLNPKSTVHVWANGGTRFTASGDRDRHHPDLQLAARSCVEFFRDIGNGIIELASIEEEYGISMWAHAQLMQIEVNGSNPQPAKLKEARRHVEELRAMYARQGIVLRPYSPPASIINRSQLAYVARRGPRHRRLTLVKS
jgi:hypothetical protein